MQRHREREGEREGERERGGEGERGRGGEGERGGEREGERGRGRGGGGEGEIINFVPWYSNGTATYRYPIVCNAIHSGGRWRVGRDNQCSKTVWVLQEA